LTNRLDDVLVNAAGKRRGTDDLEGGATSDTDDALLKRTEYLNVGCRHRHVDGDP
jgi:hypothetical protein